MYEYLTTQHVFNTLLHANLNDSSEECCFSVSSYLALFNTGVQFLNTRCEGCTQHRCATTLCLAELG